MADVPGSPGTPVTTTTAAIDLDGTTEQTPLSVSGKSVCIEVCKYEHKTKRGGRQLEMIQCSLCASWFHTECVGIKKDAPIGVWPCTSCRLIPKQIKSIVNIIGSLTKTMNTLTSSNTKLSAQFEGKEAECTELRKDNANLRTQIASLTAKLAKRTWEFYTQKPTLLIGDSLIRDIERSKPVNTSVRSLSGAKTKDISNSLSRDENRYKKVVICAGSNDCSRDNFNIDTVAEQFGELLQVDSRQQTDQTCFMSS